jgi:hypothetical protein
VAKLIVSMCGGRGWQGQKDKLDKWRGEVYLISLSGWIRKREPGEEKVGRRRSFVSAAGQGIRKSEVKGDGRLL